MHRGEGSKNSQTDRVELKLHADPDRPHLKSQYICEISDHSYKIYWTLCDELHGWFVENKIPYTLFYEFDWCVEVADEHAVMVKLALGE